MLQIRFRLGLHSTDLPGGAYSTSPELLARFEWPTFKERKRKEKNIKNRREARGGTGNREGTPL